MWLEQLEWLRVLVAVHYVGIALALGAAIVGDGVAVRVLVAPGPPPSRWLIGLMHVVVILGLALLWFSGTAILVSKYTADTIPAKVLLKLGAASILSVNALLLQAHLLPLAYGRDRPLALSLSPFEVGKVAIIGATSLSCWTAIVAVAYVPQFQVLPVETLYGMLAGLWALVTVSVIGLIAYVQMTAPEFEDEREVYAADGQWQADPFAQASPASLSSRLGQPAPDVFAGQGVAPSNDNARRQVRERLEQMRLGAFRASPEHEEDGTTAPTRAHRRGWFSWLRPRGRASVAAQGAPPEDIPPEEPSVSISEVRQACRRAIATAALVSFFANMLMLTGPLFMLQVYDRVLTSKSMPTLVALFSLVVGLFVFMGLMDFIRTRLLVRVGLRVDRLLARQVFDLAIEADDPRNRAGRAQLLKDLGSIRQFVSGAGMTAIFDMPWAPVYFLVVWMFHWSLGALALVGAAVLVALSLANEWLSRKPVMAASQHAAAAEQQFEAGRRNSEILQSMGMSERYRNRWLNEHNAELLAQTKASDVAGMLSVATKTTRLLLQSAMLAAGAYLVLGDAISPGVMIAASIIMSRALAPVELAIAHWRGLISARVGFRRLGEVFAQEGDAGGRMALPVPEGRIHVQNVFAAPGVGQDPVLKGLDFELQPGDALGVLGASGSGKSTLARVLVGVCPVMRGHVRLDGAPLVQWPLTQLGRHIGYLPQNAELFDGTVADNIARFDPTADPQAIIAAAQSANVHDMILNLTDGYNTRVGEGGAALSGGQRQRLALARALFGQPALEVLDEPNSNLDTDGEAALAAAILRAREGGRTVVVMAHRRKALENVNYVLILNDGRQAAFGTKDEVLRAAQQSRARVTPIGGAHAAG